MTYTKIRRVSDALGLVAIAAARLLPLPGAARQMGTLTQLKEIGLFHSQGLIGGRWSDAHDGRTLSGVSLR
jgi:hypothetical protein